MRLKNLELNGFKSFAQKVNLEFASPVVSIVGPNGSGKSNVVEGIRFVLGEQSMKSMRGKSGADLIFKGSKNLSKGTRASVHIYFDNSDKIFKLTNDEGEPVDLNYETISIEREVHVDGLNKYILNGMEVRLKDIHNLLASVNIGSSGHHIISQGEADRILNASGRDRREMVEDALGLKIYQYKIKESVRKLERTSLNMKEVVLLRRENAPHLNFLRRQIEKLEKAKEMQIELAGLYRAYLKNESMYLDKESSVLLSYKNRTSKELEEVTAKIREVEDGAQEYNNPKIEELRGLEKKFSTLRGLRGELDRKLGRIEGMIEMEERHKEETPDVVVMSEAEMRSIIGEINISIDEAINRDDVVEIKSILGRIKNILNKFEKKDTQSHKLADNVALQNLKATENEIKGEMANLQKEENDLAVWVEKLKSEINEEMQALRDKEREKYSFKVRQQELYSMLDLISVKENSLAREEEIFQSDIKEGTALVGHEILFYKNFEIIDVVDRHTQEEQRRKIERIKIKLEDAGLGGGAEVFKEFKDATERDNFLAKEMEDLSNSIESLSGLIKELKDKIDLEFKEGIKKINVEFQEFFSLMFGGGSASLAVVVENKRKRGTDETKSSVVESPEAFEETFSEKIVFEKGIDINISLPHKKVKELHALSGGERSLTSIALLFAMSQVNPPPFLVLDETDAALDEANSRKYGDMIEKLSKHSQLIVVTHNRETMSRAGVLYGVTIGADGGSKLLSVKFDEAAAIAK